MYVFFSLPISLEKGYMDVRKVTKVSRQRQATSERTCKSIYWFSTSLNEVWDSLEEGTPTVLKLDLKFNWKGILLGVPWNFSSKYTRRVSALNYFIRLIGREIFSERG